jgi:hypothetical protein
MIDVVIAMLSEKRKSEIVLNFRRQDFVVIFIFYRVIGSDVLGSDTQCDSENRAKAGASKGESRETHDAQTQVCTDKRTPSISFLGRACRFFTDSYVRKRFTSDNRRPDLKSHLVGWISREMLQFGNTEENGVSLAPCIFHSALLLSRDLTIMRRQLLKLVASALVLLPGVLAFQTAAPVTSIG